MINLATFGLPKRIIWGGYFLLVCTVIAAGDSLYTAYLYPVVEPIVALEICSWSKPRSFYLAGVAVVISVQLPQHQLVFSQSRGASCCRPLLFATRSCRRRYCFVPARFSNLWPCCINSSWSYRRQYWLLTSSGDCL